MRIPPRLTDERERLAALAEYGALESYDDPALDELTRLATRLFDVETALVSLVASDEQRFVARTNMEADSTSRDVSFCAHALTSDAIMVVPDATLDPRFAANPLVTGKPSIRFYAGIPLKAPGGQRLGTLCLIDSQPRTGLSEADRGALRMLAALALDRLEIRRLETARDTSHERFTNIADTSPDAIICADNHGCITFWNASAERLFGFTLDEVKGKSIDVIVPHAARGGHSGGLHAVAAGRPPKLVGRTIELEALRKDGRTFPIELSLSMWREGGEARFGAIMRDITHRRANQDQLYQLAHTDDLTHLPNRAVLKRRLAEVFARSETANVLMVDLDGFKNINDTLGHAAGDAVLRQAARRLAASAQPRDTVVRLGGDEFAVLIAGDADEGVASALADSIIRAIGQPYEIDGEYVHVGASIGIARAPDHGATADALLVSADLAMYQAKSEGRGCHRVYTEQLRTEALRRRAIDEELRQAFSRGEFELFYQPQVRLSDGALIGAEALLRWRHPERGLLSPNAFLPALETSMLAPDVGEWILDTACAQAAEWLERVPEFRMGVNLFGAQFRTGRLADDVADALERAKLPPHALELEITENIILRNDALVLEPLEKLRALGVGIAFDDFGTGFASLSMLKQFPITRLKIDRGFVDDLVDDPADAAIVNALIYLGGALGLDVIAEGVEDVPQRDVLRACGCESAQGYLYGPPVSAEAFFAQWQAKEKARVA